MRKHSALVVASLAATLALVLLVVSARSDNPVRASGGACPASFFLGFYGVTGNGFAGGAHGSQPTATVGELAVSPDPAPAMWTGTISGSITDNDGRSITRLSVSGTYRMTSINCLGSAVLIASNGMTLHYDLVLTSWVHGGIAQEVFFVRTDPRNVETLTLVNASNP